MADPQAQIDCKHPIANPGAKKLMSNDLSSPVRWWAGIFVGFVLTALTSLFGFVLKHEGTIGHWDGRLESIQHSLERLEDKLDGIRGKR